MPDFRPFLTARWRYLLMLNYEVDPAVLAGLVPAGTVLDLFEGRALVSVVGFLFEDTRVMGAAVPLHRNFEEINLRFYVRRADEQTGEARRGVVFVKEIVPKPWIARTARLLYGENYIAAPMRHTLELDAQGCLRKDGLVEYAWRQRGRINRLGGLAGGEAQLPQPGSEEEFIAEHYWGYTRSGPTRTGEYRVEHVPWLVRRVEQPYLLCQVKAVYGAAFEPFLHHRPRSAFLAEGSPVTVFQGRSIHTPKPTKEHQPA